MVLGFRASAAQDIVHHVQGIPETSPDLTPNERLCVHKGSLNAVLSGLRTTRHWAACACVSYMRYVFLNDDFG